MREKIASALQPTTLVILGSTGDLAANYLLPALFHLDNKRLLPKDFRLICVGRRGLTAQTFLNFIIKKSKTLRAFSKKKAEKRFLNYLTYYRGDFENPETFRPLVSLLENAERPLHRCSNRLYYFATSPEFFSSIARMLQRTGLLTSCRRHNREVRVLVEKPFGFNLKSAQSLNRLLLRYFSEEQIYRIDHYQGKETVQNLMVVRFANSIFEPLWNREFIDHVEISVLFDDRIGARQYFNKAGMLKDAVQNHLLEILALLAMDAPLKLNAELIRDERVKILKRLVLYDKDTITGVVKGQYRGYEKEAGRTSATETFVALRTLINTRRWLGVPFYLRTGKALSRKVTEISIHFKEPAKCLFKGCAANALTFRIQPDESVHLRINNKIPGFGINLHQANLEFGYAGAFPGQLLPAYERLLLDFFQGDQRLFIRSDEIEAAWRFIDSIAKHWKELPLYSYRPGSNGPRAAEELIRRDGRQWWTK